MQTLFETTPNRPPATGGYSLLETIVALSLVSILSLGVLPTCRQILERPTLHALAFRLEALILRAEIEAVSRDQIISLTTEGEAYLLHTVETPLQTIETGKLGERSTTEIRGAHPYLLAYPSGVVTPRTISLRTSFGECRTSVSLRGRTRSLCRGNI